MIKYGSYVARWQPHVLIDKGERMGTKNDGTDFRAWDVELKRRSQHDVIPGTTSSVNDCTLALRTSSPVAAKIVADDGITWKGEDYSVIAVQEMPTCRRIDGEDHVIYLRR